MSALRKRLGRASTTQRTAVLCAVSGIISGVLSVVLIQLEVPFLESASWPVRFAWLGLSPGIAFGLFFSLGNARSKQQILLYMPASIACCVIAGLLFGWVRTLSRGDDLWVLALGGALSGLTGAYGLLIAHQLLLNGRPSSAGVLRTLLLGAGLGVVFVFVCAPAMLYAALLGRFNPSVAAEWAIAFLLWQIPIGDALSKIRRSQPAALIGNL